ncbi:hypothetical protein G9A89_016959 [Geosiphon pyriformis]|nr:hypothetical protein G9A89_016959 [Geosiphon pyriformis]
MTENYSQEKSLFSASSSSGTLTPESSIDQESPSLPEEIFMDALLAMPRDSLSSKHRRDPHEYTPSPSEDETDGSPEHSQIIEGGYISEKIVESSPEITHEKNITPIQISQKPKFRWKLSEAPEDLLRLAEQASINTEKMSQASLNLLAESSSSIPIIKSEGSNPARRKPPRKNPNPQKSYAKEDFENDSISFTCNVFDIYTKNPRLLWESNLPFRRTKSSREGSFFETVVDKTKPPPPSMSIMELTDALGDLYLDKKMLDIIKKPKITWKGYPANLKGQPHVNLLHRLEAKAASILRMTPLQYLNAKLAILSAAKEYCEAGLPFRKVDAQKTVRIDVNKACKLWEFFKEVGWIR